MSVTLETARSSYGAMIGRENVHLLQPSLDSLEKQTFKDFEFIVSDAMFEKRPDTFNGHPFNREDYNFPIKHIPVKPYSVWLQQGLWAGQAGLNQGIIHSDGELLVFLADCCEFKEDTLELYWKWFQKGYFAMALTIYHKNGKPFFYDEKYKDLVIGTSTLEEIKKVGGFDKLVKDSRWKYMENTDVIAPCPWNWHYGYNSCSLEVALKINGFDENFDGDKALGDVDFGSRLEMAGYNNLLLDKNLYVIENGHNSVPKEVLWSQSKAFRSNYSLMLLNRKKGRFRANSYQLTEEEIEWIVEHGTHWSVLRPEVGSIEYEMFQFWLDHPPLFDLAELRLNS